MDQQPTVWEWAVFWLGTALTLYAFWHLASGLLARGRPAAPPAPRASLGAILYHAADRFGAWTIRWFWAPIGRAAWRLARLAWELPGLLWRGPAPAPSPAPVSRLSAGLPADYVAGGAEGSPQSAPSVPSVVRPSAPSGLDRALPAPLAAAAERVMLDRSREALIDLMVAADWSTTQIRGQLKGTNEAIGQEVETARVRLAAARATPIAQRPTAAQFRRAPEAEVEPA